MENPFDITVYDKDFGFVGYVVNPTYENFVPSWWNQGYGSFMLAADNPHTEALQSKGARCVVRYRGEHLMSGPIRSRRGDLVQNGTVTYQLLDDYRLLVNTLAFVRPDSPLGATSLASLGQAWMRDGSPVQDGGYAPGTITGQTGYFAWPDGSAFFGGVKITSAEQAVKWIIQKNLVERLGRPVTILPNQGRGGDPTAILPVVRMESLSEAIQPILNFSGLSVRMWQEPFGNTIFCDVVEPGVWAQTLTPESGIINSGTYAVGAPSSTRPIIGGPGETASRVFAGIEGQGLIGADEVDYNDVIETFNEAEGSFEFAWPTTTPAFADELKVPKYYPFRVGATEAARFAKFLKASIDKRYIGAVSTLEMKLSETDTFHYGGPDGIQLGDRISVKTSGETFSNQVTECQMTFTRDNGLVVEPLVGQREDDPDIALANALAAVAAAIRHTSTSK